MNKIITITTFFILGMNLNGQEDILFTKRFTKTIERHNLEFYMPTERWLKLSNVAQDEYLKYDVVLHSPPNIEVRILIDPDNKHLFPNVAIVKTMSHISSNDEDALIEVTEYPGRKSKEQYGADFALYADFDPKQSFTTYPNGRIFCLYKEGEALIQYIILYEGYLDPFFKMPLRFKKDNLQPSN